MKPTPENMAERVYNLAKGDEFSEKKQNRGILRNKIKLTRIFRALQMGFKSKARVAEAAGIWVISIGRLFDGKTKAHRAFQKYYLYSMNVPIKKCMKSVNKAVPKDPRLAMDFMERLAPEYTKKQQIDVNKNQTNTLEITINDYRALSPQERKTQIDDIAKRMGMKMIDLEKNVDGIYELASPNEKDAGSGTTGTPGK